MESENAQFLVAQGCCGGCREVQVKIQRILSSRFKPRRALLFASEAKYTPEGFEAILGQNRGVLRGV